MFTPNRIALAALTAGLFALAGCDATPAPLDTDKPRDGSADAYGRLCRDQGLPDDCDICAVRSWYGDGECDDFCPEPDPDCEDVCALEGWYGDGVCDTFCPLPDPDC